MTFLEKDLEQIIFESGIDSLQEKGLDISGKLLRQMKIGNYGVADLISFSRPFNEYYKDRYILHKGMITIYELKRDKISISSFLQALGYVKGVISFLEKKGIRHHYIVNMCLIGREIDKNSSLIYIPELLYIEEGSISFYTYQYNIDGIKFKHEYGYQLNNEGF
jgi:hypothetical protein